MWPLNAVIFSLKSSVEVDVDETSAADESSSKQVPASAGRTMSVIFVLKVWVLIPDVNSIIKA